MQYQNSKHSFLLVKAKVKINKSKLNRTEQKVQKSNSVNLDMAFINEYHEPFILEYNKSNMPLAFDE